MTSFNPDNFKELLTQIGATLPSDLRAEDFKDFGKMTSHIYRSKFYAVIKGMVDASEIQATSTSAIIYFATLIKNKKRIIDALVRLNGKYGTAIWFKDALKFYQTATVQYVSEAEKTGLFPVVNIPSCQPNLAAHFYKLQLQNDGVARSDVDLFKKFFENLWFCQMRITGALLTEHMVWETDFWNNKVKKSKNPESGRYEKGFNGTYYGTKAEDDYKWIVNGNESEETFDQQRIVTWLKTV
jgi:hypothetical protein